MLVNSVKLIVSTIGIVQQLPSCPKIKRIFVTTIPKTEQFVESEDQKNATPRPCVEASFFCTSLPYRVFQKNEVTRKLCLSILSFTGSQNAGFSRNVEYWQGCRIFPGFTGLRNLFLFLIIR